MLKHGLRASKSLPEAEGAGAFVCQWQQQSPHDNYNIQKELGRGKFGATFLATCRRTGDQYAIKAISKQQRDYDAKTVQREAEILYRLSAHPNVAGLHELYEDAGHRYIVLELCSGGELFDLIVSRGYFTEREVANVARTLLQVVEHCHRQGILHRDLKPENFLLKDRTGSIDKDNVRAIDFGLSTFHQTGQTCRQVVGSAYYLAPEVLRGPYSWQADAWSLGVIFYILLCGMPPFWGRTDSDIFKRVLHEPVDLKIEPWNEVSMQAKHLVGRLLTRDVKKRMTVREALNHPWIRDANNLPDKPMSSLMLTRLKQFTQMSKLKVTLLNLVAKHLAPAEIGSLRESFMAMDTDGSGLLTVEKLQNGLSRCSVDPRATDVSHLMTQLDARKQALSYEDFVAAALDTQQNLTAQSLSNIFSALDADGDGFLSAEELALALKGSGLDAADVDDVIKMMEQESAVANEAERHNNLHNLHRISVAGFVDIIQQSAKGELHVAQLESAARQMSAFAKSNRLKQLASLIVARTSPAENIANLKDLFETLDENQSGKIDIVTLEAGLKDKCSLAAPQVAEIIQALDLNHDGQVDYEEFVASAVAHQTILSEAKLKAAFDFIDADSDGVVSKDDLRNMLTELQVDHGELDELMKLADKNSDGLITFEEFEQLMASPVVAKPNMLNRVSAQPWTMGVRQQQPTAAAAAPLPASPVNSLMDALEQKWMQGGFARMATLPRAMTKVMRRHKTS